MPTYYICMYLLCLLSRPSFYCLLACVTCYLGSKVQNIQLWFKSISTGFIFKLSFRPLISKHFTSDLENVFLLGVMSIWQKQEKWKRICFKKYPYSYSYIPEFLYSSQVHELTLQWMSYGKLFMIYQCFKLLVFF